MCTFSVYLWLLLLLIFFFFYSFFEMIGSSSIISLIKIFSLLLFCFAIFALTGRQKERKTTTKNMRISTKPFNNSFSSFSIYLNELHTPFLSSLSLTQLTLKYWTSQRFLCGFRRYFSLFCVHETHKKLLFLSPKSLKIKANTHKDTPRIHWLLLSFINQSDVVVRAVW